MARRAQFGQAPRAQPSLSGTIVALAREMQAKRDQNIMDAWRNGGQFQGKDATDESVLAYWKARMANLDPKDPNYNAYKNQVLQLEYAIAQSKADLAHLQGKLSDTAYAQFFLKWAKKVPKNSEFWRVLQKDAAQLMEQAKNKSSVSADQAKQDAFNKYVSGRQDDIDLGNALTSAIDKISRETGLSVTGNGERLLELLTQDFAANPSEYRALADAVKGSGFDGTFTHGYVASSFNSARLAYKDVATRANKDGYASAYDSASKGQSALSDWGQNLEVWDNAQTYNQAWDAMQDVLNNPNASWMDRKAAGERFAVVAEKLAGDAKIEIGAREMLLADAARARGEDAGDSPSFSEGYLGNSNGTEAMLGLQQQTTFILASETAMLENPGAFVYAPVDDKGNFDPTGKGAVGIVPAGAIAADAVAVPVPGLDGIARMVYVKPFDIVAKDPMNPDGEGIPVGKALSYQSGASTITLYNYRDADGIERWTPRSPIADGAATTRDSKGNIVVTPAGYGDPLGAARAFDAANPGSNLESQMKGIIGPDGKPIPGTKADWGFDQKNEQGEVTGKVSVQWDGSKFVSKQTTYGFDAEGQRIEQGSFTIPFTANSAGDVAGAAISGTRMKAGNIPGVTFDSPTAAGLAASQGTMTTSQMSTLVQDSVFQATFMQQTMDALGTDNPLDPRVVESWNKATESAKPQYTTARPIDGNYQIGSNGAGLFFPGVKQPDDPSKQDLTINFGGQDIKLPNAPSYLAPAAQAGALGADTLKNNPGFAKAVRNFLPQYGPPAPVTPVTQTSTVPTATVTATPGPSPSPPPKPSQMPSPTPIPTATPAPSSSYRGYGPR